MSQLLQLVHKYREAVARRDTGHPADRAESADAGLIKAIEAEFSDAERREGRGVALEGLLCSDVLFDRVSVTRMNLAGCVCRGAPRVAEGEPVEIRIDDRDRALSYRFKAQAAWLADDVDGGLTLGLAFVGTPLVLRYRRRSTAAKPLAA
ncbi:hypothetical protein [Haliangium sp.]|uniref:hypothetical protein n=1 Tax=Haliangium sp. TaxID=2663208 RepID=UPI003D1065F9